MLLCGIILAAFLAPVLFAPGGASEQYKPDWSSIDSRPLPAWYDDSKFGIFCHWGVYSVPAHSSEWFWWQWKGDKNPDALEFMAKHYLNGTTYADFAKDFTAEDFDPEDFASIIKASGAKYFVLTSKHHEGYTLWPSKTSFSWNAVDVGPHRDLVEELSKTIRQQGLHFGLYFSLMDWFHPLYMSDPKEKKSDFVKTISVPQLHEIVEAYSPDVIWSDGDWERDDVYWQSKEFLAWLYNDSPIKDKVVVNDRWGKGVTGKHGGFLTYSDHYNPGVLLPRKWENCFTLDRSSWGYRRNVKSGDVLTLKDLVYQLASTISCNGNMLLNVGPDKYGRIIPLFEERLRQLGQFVSVNQEAIFGTKPWIHQNDTNDIWYTSRVHDATGLHPARAFNPQDEKNTVIYAYLLKIPSNNVVTLASVKATEKTQVTLLGTQRKFHPKKSDKVVVDLSEVPWQEWPSTEHIVLKVEFASTTYFNPLARGNGWMPPSAPLTSGDIPGAPVTGAGGVPGTSLNSGDRLSSNGVEDE